MRYLSPLLHIVLIVIFVTGCSEEVVPTAAPLEDAITGPAERISNTTSGVVHHVSVGGADICEAFGLPTGCDANFSLTAAQKADGRVRGQWQDTFAGGGEGIHVAVDCIHVVGNGAAVGGVITHGTAQGTDVSGQRAITAVVDNGTSANDPADQLSISFIRRAGFDTPVCDQFEPAQFPLFDLTNGQVKVW